MAPPARMGERSRTTTVSVADTYTGYDHHSMIRPELPQTFKSTALVAAVARRELASDAAVAASANAASPAAAVDAADRSSSTLPPPAQRSAGPQQGKKRPTWQPQPLPKPKATDFVVNGAGSALIAHLGVNANRLVTVVMVRDQNLILAYTPHLHIADKLIGELKVLSSVRPVPLFGYLRVDTQGSCYGVVTVGSEVQREDPDVADTHGNALGAGGSGSFFQIDVKRAPGSRPPGLHHRGPSPLPPNLFLNPRMLAALQARSHPALTSRRDVHLEPGHTCLPTAHPPSPGTQPAAQGDATWSAHVRQGHQASASGGAAS
ncbi:hypothetical protein HPB52_001744 [Rhipicephalus sanguineus]|uniref:Uncharacterized protein n=1 Tax=Rhipicephalus sanguineus TaxID=34632 RepID=A0A9D4P9V8_RHISA|nr:hypothetical protein HPB52_001744 [Rhipicephalus sanguineus]